MNWTECFINAINYIEDHMLDDISIEDVSLNSNISSFYFQRAFTIYTGYSLSEYIKSRRLYLAALELRMNDTNIKDIAYKYGYDTIESFSKAFTRFHGNTPRTIKNTKAQIKIFLPLQIKISISGGSDMDISYVKKDKMKFIGFMKKIEGDKGYVECPKFWDEIKDCYFNKLNDNSKISKAIIDNSIGEFALCMDNEDKRSFNYMICGLYNGGEVPEGLDIIEIEESLWAIFKAIGPMPSSLQAVNTKIWNEWIINNKEYELKMPIDIEWYSSGDTSSQNYESSIWLPVKKK